MPKIVIPLSSKDMDALVKLAQSKYRNPRDQARFMLVHELHRHALQSQENAEEETESSEVQNA